MGVLGGLLGVLVAPALAQDVVPIATDPATVTMIELLQQSPQLAALWVVWQLGRSLSSWQPRIVIVHRLHEDVQELVESAMSSDAPTDPGRRR